MSLVIVIQRSWGETGAGKQVLHAISVDSLSSVIDEMKIVFKGHSNCSYWIIACNSSNQIIIVSEERTTWIWSLLLKLLDIKKYRLWMWMVWWNGEVRCDWKGWSKYQVFTYFFLTFQSFITHTVTTWILGDVVMPCLLIPGFMCVRCRGFKEHLDHQGLCLHHELWDRGWSLIFACRAEASFEEVMGMLVLFLSSVIFALSHIVVAYRRSCKAQKRFLFY